MWARWLHDWLLMRISWKSNERWPLLAFCQTSKLTNGYEWSRVAMLMRLSLLLLDTKMLPRAVTSDSVEAASGLSDNIMRLFGRFRSCYRVHIVSDNGMFILIWWWLTSEQCSFLNCNRHEMKSETQGRYLPTKQEIPYKYAQPLRFIFNTSPLALKYRSYHPTSNRS